TEAPHRSAPLKRAVDEVDGLSGQALPGEHVGYSGRVHGRGLSGDATNRLLDGNDLLAAEEGLSGSGGQRPPARRIPELPPALLWGSARELPDGRLQTVDQPAAVLCRRLGQTENGHEHLFTAELQMQIVVVTEKR